MSIVDKLFGSRLASANEHESKIGVLVGVPILGIDGLSSIGYGTESALSVLMPLGAAALNYLQWVTIPILGLLLILLFSYKQTIAAYPAGGGSYTVASANLGRKVGLFSASALMVDYILTVAVSIAAGVGALISEFPKLQADIVPLCLLFLALLTLINLRGVKESGVIVAVPTYSMIVTLGIVIGIGVVDAFLHNGHPHPLIPLPQFEHGSELVSLWLIMRGFAGGCTAMTGVEAVSNGVQLFNEPRAKNAQLTLTILVATLWTMLAGSAYLAHVYGVQAMDENKNGYQSVVSIICHCVVGNSWMYNITMDALLCVLVVSANSAYAGFPRLCRLVALDGYLPHSFALLGRRLVYTVGIAFLTGMAALLIIIFRGDTDDLIPLYAVGAFLAFTTSQAGMVAHWRKAGPGHTLSLIVNLTGAIATGIAVSVIMVAKFMEGAWISILLMPILMFIFMAVKRHYDEIDEDVKRTEPLDLRRVDPPIVIVPVEDWNHVSETAMRFAIRMSNDVVAIHVQLPSTDHEDDTGNEQAENLRRLWQLNVIDPAKAAGMKAPPLEILHSPFRRIFGPMEQFIIEMRHMHPERLIAVVIPELIETKWYEFMLHNHRATQLKARLLMMGDSKVIVVNVPWYFRHSVKHREDISHLVGGAIQ